VLSLSKLREHYSYSAAVSLLLASAGPLRRPGVSFGGLGPPGDFESLGRRMLRHRGGGLGPGFRDILPLGV